MLRHVMGRVWPITLATACATFTLAASGCGDSERRDPGGALAGAGGHTLTGDGGSHRGGSAGDAGTGELAGDGPGETGGMNDGGGGASPGGGGSRPHGGSGGTQAGGSGNAGGTSAGGTGGNETTGGGAGADAGETGLAGAGTGGTGIAQLDVCVRQTTSPSTLAWDVSRAFEISVNLDCRIDWVRLLYLDPDNDLDVRVAFLNQLLDFSLDLWGCFGSSVPESFDLIWQPTPLSVADVALLIDDYVAAASGPLTLSPGEITDLRALLGRLAEPLLMDPDPGGLSNPRCDTGGAGASGAGGQAGSG